MSYQRTHKYCGGKGEVSRTSGIPGFCFPCNGTGKITVYSAAEKNDIRSKRTHWENTRALVESHAREMQPPQNVSPLIFRLDALAGFDTLGDREPERLIKLYASVSAGRITDVVYALYAYRKSQVSDGSVCTKCGKADLPKGLMCDRDVATAEMCLRCCPHNHG